MRFDWDETKAAFNLRKHGVGFETGITVFDDPFAMVTEDSDHSTVNEVRWWWIGESDAGVLVVVFTIRERGSIDRLISVRPANRKERSRYEEAKRIPL